MNQVEFLMQISQLQLLFCTFFRVFVFMASCTDQTPKVFFDFGAMFDVAIFSQVKICGLGFILMPGG